MKLTKKLKLEILKHAKECYPNECCGVVVHGEYFPCRNNSIDKSSMFEIHYQDLVDIEEHYGEIQAYVHSHPDGSTEASDLDLLQIELHEKPWIICSYSEIEYHDEPAFAVYKPSGYQAPLLGRDYNHGYLDCYSIVRDFYQREMGIELPNFEREDLWWENPDAASLYIENFEKAGFKEVNDLMYGDVLLCRVGRTEHVNHAIIYLSDKAELKSEQTEPCIGSALILHHPYERKSVREIYGENWQKRTVKIVRYKNENR